MRDADNDTNSVNIDKLITAKGHKGKVGILPMLVVIIVGGRSIKDIAFIIDLIISIGLLFIGAIGAGIKKVVKGKVVKALTRVENTNKIAIGWRPKK